MVGRLAGWLTDWLIVCCFTVVQGGLCKAPNTYPDILHSYYAVAGLAVAGAAGLAPLDPRFGMTLRACDAAGLRRLAPDAHERLHAAHGIAPPAPAAESWPSTDPSAGDEAECLPCD